MHPPDPSLSLPPDAQHQEGVGVAGSLCRRLALRVPQGERCGEGLRLENGVRPPSPLRYRHGGVCCEPQADSPAISGLLQTARSERRLPGEQPAPGTSDFE